MSVNEILTLAAVAAGGYALRHFFPNLLGGLLSLGAEVGNKPAARPKPAPAPAPPADPSQPAVDRPLAECYTWLTQAVAGLVPVDSLDVRTLRAMQPLVNQLAAEVPPAVPTPPPAGGK